nr:uncharacterized mitochondrial protein AtMg00810-like [Tanacetum cinerariifolium]
YSNVRSSNAPMDKENPWGKDGTGKDVTTKECHLHAVKRIFRYLKGHPKLGLWYPKEFPFDLVAYSDSDYGGATQDRKSTTGGCQFLDHIHTDENVTDLLTKPFDAGRFRLSMPCEALSREFSISILRIGLIIDAKLHAAKTLDLVWMWLGGGYGNVFIIVAILEKGEHNIDFHPMVDFIMASPLSQGEACPTDFGFIADQDRETIDKSSTLPHDLAPRVTSPFADEGTKFQSQEVEINRLKERVKMLEDRERVAATRSRDYAPIKGRSMDEGEAATERISDDSEGMATILTSMDGATVLASGVVDVPTGSGSIPTASTPAEELVPTGSDVVPTASPVFATTTVVARELEEQLEREDQRRSEQIARDVEIARIHAEEELQMMIDGLDRNNETIAKYLQEYHQFASELPIERRIKLITDLVKYQDNYAKIYKYQRQQRKLMTKKQKRDYYMAGIRNNLGWKVKYFRGMTFEEVEAKFNSTSEEVLGEAMSPEEVLEKKVKEMMHLVLIEEVYVEALQVKHLIIDWKVYTEGQRSYLKITRLGGSSASYQFFIDLLKHLDREDLNQLWRLVKETLSNRPPTRQINLNASGEGLPSKEGSSTCDDQLQASSGELPTDGERFNLEDIQDCKLSKIAR